MDKKKVWYHSILDPEAKVIYNDEGEIFIRDPELHKAFVSNTWINPQKKKNESRN